MQSTTIYVTAGGAYISTFVGEHTPPDGGIPVASAPEDSRQVWDFKNGGWGRIPATVPHAVDALSGLLALEDAGLSAAYKEWATSPERSFADESFISKAVVWRRDDPTIQAAADALGLTSEQVDELFIAAAAR